MQNLPGPRIEPTSAALAGRVPSTVPPRNSPGLFQIRPSPGTHQGPCEAQYGGSPGFPKTHAQRGWSLTSASALSPTELLHSSPNPVHSETHSANPPGPPDPSPSDLFSVCLSHTLSPVPHHIPSNRPVIGWYLFISEFHLIVITQNNFL